MAKEILKISTFSNPKALKIGKEAFKSFVLIAKDEALNLIKTDFFKNVLINHVSTSKFSAIGIEMALDILTRSDSNDQILSVLEEFGLRNTKPHVVAGAVKLMTSILREFGPFGIATGFYQKHINGVFLSTNLQIRKNALELAKEMYRWGGNEFLDFSLLQNLKKTQISSIKTAIESVPPKSAKPTRTKRPKQPKFRDKTDQNDPTPKHENFHCAEPTKVDVLTLLGVDQNWVDSLLKGKWQQKKELLEKVISLAEKTPNIALSDNSAVFFDAIARLLKDPYGKVVIVALRVLAPFSRGSKAEFKPFAKKFCLKVLLKFKEMKKAIETACFDALYAFSGNSISVEDVYESIERAFKDKTSKVRECSLVWLIKTFENPKSQKPKNCFNRLCCVVAPLFSDGAVAVRSKAFELFAVFMCRFEDEKLKKIVAKMKTDNFRAYKTLTKLKCEKIKNLSKIAALNAVTDSESKRGKVPYKTVAEKGEFGGEVEVEVKVEAKTAKIKLKEGSNLNLSGTRPNAICFGETKDSAKIEFSASLLKHFDVSSLRKLSVSRSLNQKAVAVNAILGEARFKKSCDEFCEELIDLINCEVGLNKVDGTLAQDIWALVFEMVRKSSKKTKESVFEGNLESLVSSFVNSKLSPILSKILGQYCEEYSAEKVLCRVLKTLNNLSTDDSTAHPKTCKAVFEWAKDIFSKYGASSFPKRAKIFNFIERMGNHSNDEDFMAICKNATEFLRSLCAPQPKKVPKMAKMPRSQKSVSKSKSPAKSGVEFAQRDLSALRRISSDLQLAKELAEKHNWRKNQSALEKLAERLKEAIASGCDVSAENIAEIFPLLESLKERLKDNILAINRLSLYVLRLVLELVERVPERVREKISAKVFSLTQEGLFVAVGSVNKQIRVSAKEIATNFFKEMGFESFAKKTAAVTRSRRVCTNFKAFCLESFYTFVEMDRAAVGRINTSLRDKIFLEILKNAAVLSKESDECRRIAPKLKSLLSRTPSPPENALSPYTKHPKQKTLSARLKTPSTARSLRKPLRRLNNPNFATVARNSRKSYFEPSKPPEKLYKMRLSENPPESQNLTQKTAAEELPNSVSFNQNLRAVFSAQIAETISGNDEKKIAEAVAVLGENLGRFVSEAESQLPRILSILNWLSQTKKGVRGDCVRFLGSLFEAMEKRGRLFDAAETDLSLSLLSPTDDCSEAARLLPKLRRLTESKTSFCRSLFAALAKSGGDSALICLKAVSACLKKDADLALPLTPQILSLLGLDSQPAATEKIVDQIARSLQERVTEKRLQFLVGEAVEKAKNRPGKASLVERRIRRLKWRFGASERASHEDFSGDTFVLPAVFRLDCSKVEPVLIPLERGEIKSPEAVELISVLKTAKSQKRPRVSADRGPAADSAESGHLRGMGSGGGVSGRLTDIRKRMKHLDFII